MINDPVCEFARLVNKLDERQEEKQHQGILFPGWPAKVSKMLQGGKHLNLHLSNGKRSLTNVRGKSRTRIMIICFHLLLLLLNLLVAAQTLGLNYNPGKQNTHT